MKFPAAFLTIFLACAPAALAQVPAQPADPNQPIPAQPVQPPAPPVTSVPAAPDSAAPPAPAASVATGPSLSIIADASLKAVLAELAQAWADSQPSGPQMPITLTNAGTMRSKIEAGTTWDLAIDSDVNDTKEMTDRGFLRADGQRSLARNSLVIYGRAPLVKDDDLDWFDLVGSEWKKVAMGNADLTTSGRVARRALQKHGLLDDDHKSLYVSAANEAAALQLVQRQQADAAFVFKTDLGTVSLPNFQSFALKTEEAPPIFYTAAVFRLAKSPDLARAFIQFCGSEAARPIWVKYGFETN